MHAHANANICLLSGLYVEIFFSVKKETFQIIMMDLVCDLDKIVYPNINVCSKTSTFWSKYICECTIGLYDWTDILSLKTTLHLS